MINNKNKTPFFSIILPTYNRSQILNRAVQSILDQQYPHFELIIVDDCSQDDTPHVINGLEKKDTRIRSLRLEENQGQSGARNAGIFSAQGACIALIDDDDEIVPTWLFKANKKIASLPESWGVLYPRQWIKDDMTGIPYPNVVSPMEGYIFKRLMKGELLPIGASGAFIKKEALLECGGFDINMFGIEDYDLWFTLSKKWTFHFINAPLVIVHEHQGPRISRPGEKMNSTQKRFIQKWEKDMIRYGGKEIFSWLQKKKNAEDLFSQVRKKVFFEGRRAALRFFLSACSKSNFRIFMSLKILLIILFGLRVYDILRRIRGSFYWSIYKLKRRKHNF